MDDDDDDDEDADGRDAGGSADDNGDAQPSPRSPSVAASPSPHRRAPVPASRPRPRSTRPPIDTVDELDELPYAAGYTEDPTPGRRGFYGTALDHDIAALREEYNVLSARVSRDTALMRALEQREEARTRLGFGEYASPFVPAPSNRWEVREAEE
uniref:N-acyl homoserine lactonase (AHL-lactonase) (Acyl-homoserine lactonase) (EC) n=1 Tax=Ganoderma boninense TaxID=34458 RepID=A0A5K1K2N2_9APHY|nr:N-acyl homoserine lactonase (AHL-lactonase) (Acyl-homoserine lactonase) (EC [Ganoderma boninense]